MFWSFLAFSWYLVSFSFNVSVSAPSVSAVFQLRVDIFFNFFKTFNIQHDKNLFVPSATNRLFQLLSFLQLQVFFSHLKFCSCCCLWSTDAPQLKIDSLHLEMNIFLSGSASSTVVVVVVIKCLPVNRMFQRRSSFLLNELNLCK